MDSPFQRPYVDSSFFFAIIKKEAISTPGGMMRWEIAEHILEDAEKGIYKLYTSTVTLAEVRRIREKQERLDDKELETIQKFFEHEFIELIEVTREVAEKAQILGSRYELIPIDAIHLATAIWWECDVLLVWDKRFSRKFQDALIEGVRVIEPYWTGQISSNM